MAANEGGSGGVRKYLKVNDWVLGEVIGSGADSVVRLAVHHVTKEKAAVKVIDTKRLARQEQKPKKDIQRRIRREIEILTRLDHPHIVQMREALWNGDEV
eukprot:CAMPEP_0119154604 /NCGR_PEP_ID=MMETSP1310-20130426/51027_1 /TAXON_ID=464262 /ORGANISM="Genus nov. species nov., Strain RCC2339" /LENGTH=99 /DNA_ID=CAMNT_0007147143 /DNA_START=75 /DNA_END=370 /DNA_ORIENTATION=+